MTESKVQYDGYRHPDDPTDPFILPWFRAADSISLWMDVSAVLPNPMSPALWPRESSGPTIRIAEQALYTAKAADLFNPKLTSVDYEARGTGYLYGCLGCSWVRRRADS
jgi:hypothetical protein